MGFFQDQRVELIDGEIFDMAPQKDFHSGTILLVLSALQKAMPDFLVRPQLPLLLGPKSEPEPDISVVAGQARDYMGTGHPTSAVLVVEVSDTTLRFDRGKKASLYARAGIEDYWIVNLIDNCVEVMREPIEDAAAPLGYRYKSMTVIRVPASISPLAKPHAAIAVADLLF